jgi:hypothetical protein
MKTFIKLTLIVLFLGTGHTFAQTVASDRNLNVDLESYDTFDWSSHAANEQDVYFLSDAMMKSKIREAVKYEMEARGYEHTESDADLVINFRIFDEATTFQGYEATYVDENYWGPNEIRKDAIGIIPDPELREWDEREDYYMEEGSLLIQLVEKETGQIVWQGYITEMMTTDETNKVQQAVHKIFSDEFNFESSSEDEG